MAQKPETVFSGRVRDALSILPDTWFVKTQMVATRGIPDYLVCIRGQFVAIELKRSSSVVPDPLQMHILSAIALAGGTAIVASPESWPATHKILKDLAAPPEGEAPNCPTTNKH